MTGEVRDATTNATLSGATVSVDTGQTTTTDALGRYRIDLPPGTYQVTAAAPGHVSSTGTTVDQRRQLRDTRLSGSPRSLSRARLTFAPVADAQVRSSSPTKNYGTETEIRLRLGVPANADHAVEPTALRRLGARRCAPCHGAKLRLRVTDAGPHGGILYRTASGWTETGVTWNTRPAPIGSATVPSGAVAARPMGRHATAPGP